MSRAVAKRPGDALVQALQGMQGEVGKSLPSGGSITAQTFVRGVVTAVRENPKLAQCDKTSFLLACLQSARLGLVPNDGLGKAWLIPYGRQAQLQLGYQGMLELARRSGEISMVYAACVHEADEVFDYELGLEPKLKHKPTTDPNKGELTHTYAVAHLKDGGRQFVVLGKAEIDKVRATAKGKGGPWSTHYDAMAMKTAIRRLAKWLPMSSGFARAVFLEDQHEAGVKPQYDPEVLEAVPVERGSSTFGFNEEASGGASK